MLNQKELLELFVNYSKRQTFQGGPQNLYDPVRYILSIGGKKIRPILTLMAAQAFSAKAEKVLPAAFAIELFHNFSLLHDDIMDEAPLRRGKQSVHIKYGLNSGILSGDVMLVLVYDYLAHLPNDATFKDSLSLFNKAAIEVCEGQQLDVDFESMSEVPEKLYLEMVEKKTAALLGAALGIGSYPFTSRENSNELIAFGRNLGIAFQLRDDLLDTFGETHKVGKQKGGDILQNKKTILTIHATESANSEDQSRLKQLFSTNDYPSEAKIKEVTEIYMRSGAKRYTEEKIIHYQELALRNLANLNISDTHKQPFFQLSESLMNREY